MSKLKIFGISASRAIRSLWAIEETGIEYEQIPVSFKEDSKTPEYLTVNPNGKVPALVDGEVTIFESMAINLYLAKHYAKALYPLEPGLEASVFQWTLWGISEIEPLQMPIVVQKFFVPEEKRNEKIIVSSEKQLLRPLKMLDEHLAERDWLLDGEFSIADLNLAAVMLLLQMIDYDYSAFPNVSRWAAACYQRPALVRARQLP